MAEEPDPELEALRNKRAMELKKQLESKQTGMHWPDRPIEITDANFREVIAKYPLLVIDFWAEWCAPCRMMSPILDSLARTYQGKVVFGKLNVDLNPHTSNTFKVASIPTMMIIKEREMVERITGAIPKANLEQYLRKHI
jgi:thioredoxin 1